MKKIIMSIMIAFCIGNFAMAQTQSAVKKATLMPEGSQVVDLKTGEVVRTVKGGVSISDIERNTINLVDPQNGGSGKTGNTPDSSNTNKTNLGKTNGTQPKSQTLKKD